MGDAGDVSLTYVDCKDFPCHQLLRLPRKDRRKWFSHNFNGPGLKYEIATCIRTGEIVHFSGPFRAAIHDLTVFRHHMKKCLRSGEKALGDRGYRGDRKIVTIYEAKSAQHARTIKAIGARHETVNGRLATFEALRQVWRHDLSKHHIAFRAGIVLAQVSIIHGRPVYKTYGYTDPLDIDEESVASFQAS